MSIKNLQLEFFYENKPFTELGISPLYVFSSPEINPSNLEQFFRKSTEIKSIKERIKKNERLSCKKREHDQRFNCGGRVQGEDRRCPAQTLNGRTIRTGGTDGAEQDPCPIELHEGESLSVPS